METNISNVSKIHQLKSALANTRITESSIVENRIITYLDEKKVCFLIRTKIHLNNEWIFVGESEIQEFHNTVESLKLLKNGVPEPFLAAVLTVWQKQTNGKKIQNREEFSL